jgi:lysyl-tRNA synthetase, class II
MDNLFNERKKALEELISLGIEPYATGYDRNANTEDIDSFLDFPVEQLQEKQTGEIRLSGRLMTFREHGKICFGQLQDFSGRVQICFLRDHTKVFGISSDDESLHERVWKKLLDMGDFIGVEGDFFRTKHGEKTLLIRVLTILTKSLRPLPEKWHGIATKEQCYRERNLDLLSNPETMKRFRLRSTVLREIRSFFMEKDFYEIETRILQPQAGGAMAKVFHTHHNALDHNFVLRIALELDLKMTMGGGFERIFEIGKNFRNEGIDPSHLQEFTMCEWYAAYETLRKNREWTEELFHHICEKCLETSIITLLDKNEKACEIDFSKPFHEARFGDLLKEYAGLDMFSATDEEVRETAKRVGVEKIQQVGRANLLDDIYKKTARGNLVEPTFVFDYPEDLKPLARPNGDGTASCFQLVINGWEIVNSYGELINPSIQRLLLEVQSNAKKEGDEEAMEIDEVFLKAMEHGFPPMTGSGFGVDRLVALFTAQPNLRDVVLFPTMKPENSSSQSEE